MSNPWSLMNTIPSVDESLLIFVHEAGPPFQHKDHVEFSAMYVPTRSLLGRIVSAYKLRYYFSPRGFSDT